MSSFNTVKNTGYRSETRIRWVQQQKREIRIHERFYDLNQKSTSKLQEAKTIAARQVESNNKIEALQTKISNQFHRYANQRADLKQQLMTVQKKVYDAQKMGRQKILKRKDRIAKLKRMIEYEFIQHKYISQSLSSKVSPNLEEVLAFVKTDHEIFNQKKMKVTLLASKNKLYQQIEALKDLNQKNKRQSGSELETTANEFQKQMKEWKKGLLVATMAHNQILKKLRTEIDTAYSEMEAQIKQQKQMRQQNKEKLLVLLETSSRSMTGKMKKTSDE